MPAKMTRLVIRSSLPDSGLRLGNPSAPEHQGTYSPSPPYKARKRSRVTISTVRTVARKSLKP